jgi:hypothetical protein
MESSAEIRDDRALAFAAGANGFTPSAFDAVKIASSCQAAWLR